MTLQQIPALPGDALTSTRLCRAPPRMRIFQVFVNVEGLRIYRRGGFAGLIRLPSLKRYGFYAVLSIAAKEDTDPPLLLALAQDALVYEFSVISPTPPQAWRFQMLEWRGVGAAPPIFAQPGCIDDGWGAAWYRMGDEKTKQQRHRLVRIRLWKGKRARRPPALRTLRGAPGFDARRH